MSGLFKWGARKPEEPASGPAPAPVPAEAVATSKVLPRFFAALAQQPAPVIMDLGPVVGPNVAFLGERFACRLLIEDFFAEVEAASRRGSTEGLLESFDRHLAPLEPGSVDGILCWDLFDFLDRTTGQALAARLTALLRPGGALYASFGTTPIELTHYTRVFFESDQTFRTRTFPATAVKRTVLVTRDINRMFEGLRVAEAVLLKSSTRETLFRKA